MPQSHPRFGRAVPARRKLLLPALLLSCAAALAYNPFGRAGAQDDADRQGAAATAPAAVPGSGLDAADAPRRRLSPPAGSAPEPEATAAPSKGGDATAAAATETMAAATEVTWRAADGPRVISGTYVIPAGTNVTVEPGVRIQIQQNSTLVVEGALVGRGTPDRHITITGFSDYSSDIQVPGGRFEFEYTDISAQSDPRSGGTYTCSNCRWTGSSGFYTPLGYMNTRPPFVEIRQSTFDGHPASLTIDGATVVLRDVAFINGAYGRIFYSYVFIDNVRSDNSAEFGLQFRLDGRWHLNNIQVRNAALAALDLGGGNRGGDFHLGPNVTLAGSKFPVNLESGGLLPDSTLPASGNTNNYIVADTPGNPDWRGPMTWAPQSIPYVVLSSINLRGGGDWRMLPGTSVKFGPSFAGITDESLQLIARGLPEAPVVFDRFDPAQSWGSIGNTSGGNRYAHVRLEGSKHGINTTVHNGAFAYVEDLVLSNNETGAGGGVMVTGTRFYNNTTGYQETGVYAHSVGVLNAAPASPNSFEGNGVAVRATDSVIAARGNWWNSPTGPRHPSNPGGTGEIIEGASEFIPFLTSRPDYADAPPVVRQHKPHFTYDPGTKINITWDAADDRSIVSHRILFNPDGNYPSGFQTIAEGLPGTARAYSWTVPPVGYAILYGYSTVRVVSVDSAGHERFDDRFIQVPSGEMTGNVRITSNLAGQTLLSGQSLEVTFVAEGDARSHVIDAFLQLDNDAYVMSIGGVAGSLGQLSVGHLPYISTDRARLAFRVNGGRNRVKWFYGEYFSIRPDQRVGDAAPSVSIVSPSPGSAFQAGGDVRVSWSAFDDEGVRSFAVLASYDAGRSWNLLAEELPATASSYDLPTAAGAGVSNVRVRVVATDRRFQQSSAESSFALTPTAPPNAPPAVSLQRPTAGSAYVAGATLNLTAEASDADGSIAKVEFFAGTTLVGADTAAPYDFAWQNVPAGTHAVFARATDNAGAQKDSPSVGVTVHAEPPPASAFPGATWGALYNGPSNGGDVASIMALDASGNVHLTASSYGVGSSQDIVTAKYDPAGRQLWVARYGNPDDRVEYSDDIAVDARGNVYVTGTAWRGLGPDGGTDYDFITIKYDAAGNQQWVRFYTGTSDAYGRALEPDAAGNVYVTGSSYFTRADGNPANQIVLLKYDPAGNLLWTRTYAGPEGRGAVPVDLKLDAAGNPYVGGTVAVMGSNGASDNNLAVVKYDAAGNVLRAAQYDVPGTNLQDFDAAIRLHLGAGGVFLIGQSWPDQCCEVTRSRYDSVLLKFDAELVFKWAARFGLPGDQTTETPNDLVSDAAGNVYVVGSSSSTSRAGDAFTLKYDAAGKLLWQRIFEGSTYKHADAVAVVLDPAGGVQVGVEALGAANYDYTLVRYLADGAQSGVRQFNGPANLDDILEDVKADAAGNIYLTGVTFTNNSGADVLTVKVAPGAAPTPTPTPTPTPVPTATPTPTPAPTTSLINFALASNGGVASASSTTTQAELPGTDFSPSGAIDGDRRGVNWQHGGGWRDATNNTYPDWLQVDFAGAKTITEAHVFTLQDSDASPSEPTQSMTFSKYGVTAFDLLYWDGAGWAAVPGASVVGNDRVWRKLTFPAVTTTRLRLVARNALAGRSRVIEFEAWGASATTPPPAGARINAALASNGGVASASSTTTQAELPGTDFSPSGAIDGDRKGVNWQHGGGWRDATNNAYPDWLEVSFAAPTAVDEVNVFTLQDDDASPSEPTEAMAFTKYGVTSFVVQYWDGAQWVAVPGGTITNNSSVWRKLTFPAVTTTKVRVVVNAALAGRSRLIELEAWGVPAAARVNHAAAANGAAVAASSTTPDTEFAGMTFPVAPVIDGDRRGLNWERGGGWRDGTGGVFPDWVEVSFAGARKVDEVGVFTVQDEYASPSEPTPTLTFTKYGVTAFEVQYWTGSAWATVPGGAVAGNNLVWRRVTFPAVVTTKVRVVIHGGMGGRSRLVEVEARGPAS